MKTLRRVFLTAFLTGSLVGPLVGSPQAHALDNGLALTPPMGWSSWNKFGCDIDQWKIREIADAMVSSGLKDVGYQYVNIDDCWQATKRLPTGELTWNSKRFPDGIPALARYVHSKGLKLGIYGNPGKRSCASWSGHYEGNMGSLGHEYQDARTFARWGIDYLKYDDCWSKVDGVVASRGFTTMSRALRAAGRPIVYSIHNMPQQPISSWVPKVANLWRTTADITDNWVSVSTIALLTLPLSTYAGPGHWNDPDMLEVGNGGLTSSESRSHITLWAMLAAPLILGNDLRTMSTETRKILTNKLVLQVDQDRLGRPARVVRMGRVWVLIRPLAGGRWAVSMTNVGETPYAMAVGTEALGITGKWIYEEAWSGLVGDATDNVSSQVNPHDSVLFILSPEKD